MMSAPKGRAAATDASQRSRNAPDARPFARIWMNVDPASRYARRRSSGAQPAFAAVSTSTMGLSGLSELGVLRLGHEPVHEPGTHPAGLEIGIVDDFEVERHGRLDAFDGGHLE